MKKLFFVGLMAMGMFTASAQNKIGYISTEDLISDMPEAEKADNDLKQYQADLTQQGQDMMKDLSMKEIKRAELIDLYQKVQNWNQQAQEMYQRKAQDMIAPLRNKALDAIKAVAKESGYTYVLDINSVIVAPPGDDILPLVKKKLGIKDTAQAPAKKP
jgi:outer membrane protein